MNKLSKSFLYLMAGLLITFTACNDDNPTPVFTAGFEELSFPAGTDAFYGQDKTGERSVEESGTIQYSYTYESGNARFGLNFFEDESYGTWWNGIAYSKQTNNTLEGTEGMLVAMPGAGADDSEVYAIMNGSDTITFEGEAFNPQSIQLTNNAYAHSVIEEGNQFSKKFGGVEGNDPDYFKVIITGIDEQGAPTGEVEFYLADFRFDDNSKDYIVDSWIIADLSPLGSVSKLAFSYESSDTGDYGINTPLYVAFDNLIVQAEEEE